MAGMNAPAPSSLPPVTLVIEWENAMDVADAWTRRAMGALERELAAEAPNMAAKPQVMYLFDSDAVRPEAIRGVLEAVAPRLPELADLQLVPAPGMTYYKLKNYGIGLASTELAIMLDSDAAPQPGWLRALLAPFTDPEVMAVGGFTVLGHEDLLSRTMALSWVFNLPHERTKTERRQKIHVNNCAVRTAWFRQNPFRDMPAFKKQCGLWLRDFSNRGFRFVRTPEAMTVHAPHPGFAFLAWRSWVGGKDADFLAFQTIGQSRGARVAEAFRYFARKTGKGWRRIWRHGHRVDLPAWQRPAAMLIVLAFYGNTLVSQLWSALTRSFELLPETYRQLPPKRRDAPAASAF
jgi:hypothetical protein